MPFHELEIYIFVLFIPLYILYVEVSFFKVYYDIDRKMQTEDLEEICTDGVICIIPARNEEDVIEECINSIQNNLPLVSKIVVVNDQSNDNTGAIIKKLMQLDSRINLIEIDELPIGWTGKNYALYKGAISVDAEWLFFIDADVIINKKTIQYVISYMKKNNINVFSFSPYQIRKKFYEQLMQPTIFNLINYLYPLDVINTENSNLCAVNGAFIAMKKDDYIKLGGHQVIKDKVLEDVEFAKKAWANGYRIKLMSGYPLVKSRMYRNFIDLWNGWSKNIYLLIKASNRNFLLLFLRNLLILFYPFYLFFILDQISVSLVLFFVIGIIESIARYKNKFNWEYGMLYILSRLIMLLIMLNSYIKANLLKRVIWKRRIYWIKE